MAIYDLYSKRLADAAKSGEADVYQYSNLPQSLRVQVEHISREALGVPGIRTYSRDEENAYWHQVEKVFKREKGLDQLGRERFGGDRVLQYMRACPVPDWLDLLELITVMIQGMNEHESKSSRQEWLAVEDADDAIAEINYRLRQAGLGYQVEDGSLIRVDSQFLHAEVVKPSLSLLSGHDYEGPRQEFLQAHMHYRSGEFRQAVAMAANALESTLKAVFDSKNWEYQKGARISDLVKVAKANQLWPDFLDASFDQLTAALQNGLPKVRDNTASHGQGAKTKEVPPYVAAYALHLAASNIVFITSAAGSRTK